MRRIHCLTTTLVFAVIWFAGETVSWAQNAASPGYLKKGKLNPAIRGIPNAIGTRTEIPGKERIVFQATKTVGGGSPTSVLLTYEWPGKVRIDDQADKHSSVFDGNGLSSSSGKASNDDADISEILTEDSTEGMLASLVSNSNVRLVDTNVRIVDGSSSNRLTGTCDLFQVNYNSSTRGQKTTSEKFYCFDSKTKLLSTVVYKRGAITVETRILGWKSIGSDTVPTSIRRMENGVEKFTLQFASTQLAPLQSDSTFQKQQ